MNTYYQKPPPPYEAIGLGAVVVAVVLFTGGLSNLFYQAGVFFGGVAIAMFICYGFSELGGILPSGSAGVE